MEKEVNVFAETQKVAPHKPHPIEELRPRRADRLLKIVTSFYAVTLGVTLVSLGLFSWLAEEVLEKEFTRINTSILLGIHHHVTAGRTEAAFFFTDLGSVVGISVIGILVAFVLWRTKRFVDLGTFAVVIAGAAILVFVLKLLFHQVRPDVFPPLAVEHNYSFPSGHSLMSFSFWGFFAWWIVSLKPRHVWRWIVAGAGLGIAACVALSRLYLGVHWPTDVLGGMLLGFGWVAICVTGQRWLTRHARAEKREQNRQGAGSAIRA